MRARRRCICSSTACSISANVACGCAALHCATAAKISSPCAFQRSCKSSGCILALFSWLFAQLLFSSECTTVCFNPPTPHQQAGGAKKCIAPLAVFRIVLHEILWYSLNRRDILSTDLLLTLVYMTCANDTRGEFPVTPRHSARPDGKGLRFISVNIVLHESTSTSFSVPERHCASTGDAHCATDRISCPTIMVWLWCVSWNLYLYLSCRYFC